MQHFIRDYAMYAAIFGLFGFVWFGMAQESPPKSWRRYLALGSFVSLVVGGLGIYLAATHWQAATALQDKGLYWVFGAVVATEALSIAVGSALLAKYKKKQFITSWIALVVGAHFLPLAWLFQDAWLVLLALVVCAIPRIAIYVAQRSKLTIATLTAASVGVVLLAFAVRGLVLFII